MARNDKHRPRRPIRQARPSRPAHGGDTASDSTMLDALRSVLRSPDPAEFLTLMSGAVRTGERLSGLDDSGLALFVDGLEASPSAETTGALRVIEAFTTDEALRTRVAAILPSRRQHLPPWLAHLGEACVDGPVMAISDILGDNSCYVIPVRFAGGEEVMVLVFVGWNFDRAVMDGSVLPGPQSEVVAALVDVVPIDAIIDRLDPATARATLEESLVIGSLVTPPFTSETWPVTQPLVNWAIGLLPAGGTASTLGDWDDWDHDALDQLHDDFFASPEGRGLDSPDARSLLNFVTDYAVNSRGDTPLRWSPAAVQVLLEWVPQHLLADADYLAPLADLLLAWVPYTWRRRDVDPTLARMMVPALRSLTDAFLQVLDSREDTDDGVGVPRHPDASSDIDESLRAFAERRLQNLAFAVGGAQQLVDLDTAPVPDEPFDWTGLPTDIRPAVTAWLDLTDRCADGLFDVEHRTVFRRFLARVALGDPAIFRRAKASPAREAAALVYAAARANQSVGQPADLTVATLLAWFGISGSVYQRAKPLVRAAGGNPELFEEGLGSADLLVGRRRAEIIDARTRWLQKLGIVGT